MKNPLTLPEIEQATFRFVAQHLNHCATVVPYKEKVCTENPVSELTEFKYTYYSYSLIYCICPL